MSKWNEVVKNVWNKNKHRSGYLFKHALKDAKKVYGGKNTGTMKMNNSRKSRNNKTRKNRH